MDDETRTGRATPAVPHHAAINHLRSVAATALTLPPAVAVAWTAHAWSARLPDPLPTHWRELSTPDGFSSYGGTWQTLVVVAGVGALLGAFGGALSWLNPLWQRATTALGAAVGYGALGLWLGIARAAWNRPDAHDAPLSWGVALPVVAGVVGAVLVLAVIGRRSDTRHTTQAGTGPASALVLAPGERAVWSHRTFVAWPLLVAVVLLVVALVLGVTADPVTAAVLAAAGLVAGVFAWVQVTVDARGLRLGLGPWAWTVKKVPLADIASTDAEEISAGDWGGWGYRVMPGRSALVLRSGPAVVLTLSDGRRFAVTVDDPQTPAALLDAFRARARAGAV
jgi:hypothetical protein